MTHFSRTTSRGFARTLVVVGSLIMLVFTLNPGTALGDEKVSSKEVAIRVDQETITRAEFRKIFERTIEKYRKQKGSRSSGDTGVSEKFRKKVKNRLKTNVVKSLTLRSHARQSGVEVSDTEVEEQWKALAQRAGGEKTLKKQLTDRGKSKREFLSRIRDKVLVEKFVQARTPDPTVTDTEVREYYNKRKRFQKIPFEKASRFLRKRLKRSKRKDQKRDLAERLKQQSEIEVNV